MTNRIVHVCMLIVLTIFAAISANAQSTNSCYSQSGSISANMQIFHADKIDEPVVFDATSSTGIGDFFKEPIDWDFGDGFKAKMCRATHVYRTPGTYTVTLTVRNNAGTQSTITAPVTISSIPAAAGNNILAVVTNGSGNGLTTFNTIQAAVDKAATLNSTATVEVIIPAGATFVENVILRIPVGNNYITLRSSSLGNLAREQRVNRSDLSNVATIKSPLDNNNLPAIRTELLPSGGGICSTSQTCLPSHHYRLQGIQFMVDPGTANGQYEQILGIGTDDAIQNEESEQAHHFILDRCLIYREDYSIGNPNPQRVKNGFEANARNLSVVDSHFSGVNSPGNESHAMTAYNSTGVWGVINNYFEAGSIPFLVGGAFPIIPNAFVHDVEVRHNRFHKPLEKRNLPVEHKWDAKVNFEIKAGRYWVIEENSFDGNWIGSDQAYNVNVNALAADTGGQSTVQDIQFSNNVVKQGPAGILIGHIAGPFLDAPFPARLNISNNLITEVGGELYGIPSCQSGGCSSGQGFVISTVYSDMVIRHNTLFVRRNIIDAAGNSNRPMLFQDNITNHGSVVIDGELGYGIKGDGTNRGCQTIDPLLPGCAPFILTGSPVYFAGSIINRNVIAGTPYYYNPNYPLINTPYPFQTTNYYFPTQDPNNPTGLANIDNHYVNRTGGNYRVVSGTPGKNGASDGLDVGANIDIIDLVTVSTVSGVWNPGFQTQTPYPGPTIPSIPSILEVENYDNGGEGIAYHDNVAGNNGNVYRSNDADIQARSNASNGFEVFNASAGEWLEYAVNVPFARKYDIGVRYASEFNNGKFRIQDCGNDPNNQLCSSPVELTGQVTLASTGNWNNFRVAITRGVQLSSGTHVLRLKMDVNSPDGCNCVVADFDSIVLKSTLFDYDDDGRADVSVYRPSSGTWYLDRSRDGFTALNLGLETDVIAPADFDGDGKTDVSVFRSGTWYRYNSSNGQLITTNFGLNGDIPVQADYDGDGKADLAVWRPTDKTWYRLNSFDGSYFSTVFGLSGDKPAVGDYDGDGKYDLAVFRPSTGQWFIQYSSTAVVTTIVWGLNGDRIAPADYDGDGKTDLTVFRPSDGTWYRLNSTNGQAVIVPFGLSIDLPTPADFDGDGRADIAIYRSGAWYIFRSTEGLSYPAFGLNGDIPTPFTFVQ